MIFASFSIKAVATGANLAANVALSLSASAFAQY